MEYENRTVSWRPYTKLFALTSIDGKISTGPDPKADFDADLPEIPGVAEGLYQYYDLEKETDVWALSTIRTQAKMCALYPTVTRKVPVTMVVLGTHPVSSELAGWLHRKFERVVVMCQDLPDYSGCSFGNVEYYNFPLTIRNAMSKLRDMGCEAITCGVGGTMASLLFSQHLIDEIDLVVAPLIVGGKQTPTLVDGIMPQLMCDMDKWRPTKAAPLKYNYLHLIYKRYE